MEINNAFAAGVSGLQQADRSIAQSAQRISELNVENSSVEPQPEQAAQANQQVETQQPVNLTEEVVNLRVQELQSEAAASVIQTADDVVGTLIDLEV